LIPFGAMVGSDKIPSVSQILLLARESSSEFFLLWCGNASVRAELPVLHQEDAESISKSTSDSPSSLGHLLTLWEKARSWMRTSVLRVLCSYSRNVRD
jgi:hypothetical protein